MVWLIELLTKVVKMLEVIIVLLIKYFFIELEIVIKYSLRINMIFIS
jgi:hypothetical protein